MTGSGTLWDASSQECHCVSILAESTSGSGAGGHPSVGLESGGKQPRWATLLSLTPMPILLYYLFSHPMTNTPEQRIDIIYCGVHAYHLCIELDGNPHRTMPNSGLWEYGWRYAKDQFEPKPTKPKQPYSKPRKGVSGLSLK